MNVKFLLVVTAILFSGCANTLSKEQIALSYEDAKSQRELIKGIEERSREIDYERLKKRAEAKAIANQLPDKIIVTPYHVHYHKQRNRSQVYAPNQLTSNSDEVRGN